MVFMDLTNCFRKKFYGLLEFCFHLSFWFPIDLVSSINDLVSFSGVILNLVNSFSCYLMSVLTSSIFVLKNHR